MYFCRNKDIDNANMAIFSEISVINQRF